MAFRLCTKQSAGGKSQEDKQLEFAFVSSSIRCYYIMFFDIFLNLFYPSFEGFSVTVKHKMHHKYKEKGYRCNM